MEERQSAELRDLRELTDALRTIRYGSIGTGTRGRRVNPVVNYNAEPSYNPGIPGSKTGIVVAVEGIR